MEAEFFKLYKNYFRFTFISEWNRHTVSFFIIIM